MSSKLLFSSEVVEAIKFEIDWHEKHEDVAPNVEFQKGFIRGLHQALLLIEKTEQSEAWQDGMNEVSWQQPMQWVMLHSAANSSLFSEGNVRKPIASLATLTSGFWVSKQQ